MSRYADIDLDSLPSKAIKRYVRDNPDLFLAIDWGDQGAEKNCYDVLLVPGKRSELFGSEHRAELETNSTTLLRAFRAIEDCHCADCEKELEPFK